MLSLVIPKVLTLSKTTSGPATRRWVMSPFGTLFAFQRRYRREFLARLVPSGRLIKLESLNITFKNVMMIWVPRRSRRLNRVTIVLKAWFPRSVRMLLMVITLLLMMTPLMRRLFPPTS